MSSKTIDDGGLAFPGNRFQKVGNSYGDVQHPGMTLRDWFAGQAMAAIISRPITDYADGMLPTFAETAADAMEYADALIAARKAGA